MLPIEARIQLRANGVMTSLPSQSLMFAARPKLLPYMKPHMSTATTAGTAYGRKITMRKKPEACSRALSIASAATQREPEHDRHLDEQEQRRPGRSPPRTAGRRTAST